MVNTILVEPGSRRALSEDIFLDTLDLLLGGDVSECEEAVYILIIKYQINVKK